MVMADPCVLLARWSPSWARSRKQHGWQYFEKLRANDIMLVQGNQQVADMVKRGERLIAVGADAAYVGDARKNGSAVLDHLPAGRRLHHSSRRARSVKGSPNPNAAKAFADFMLSRRRAGAVPARVASIPARTDVAGPEGNPPLGAIKIHPIDYDCIEAETTRIKRRFAEVLQ